MTLNFFLQKDERFTKEEDDEEVRETKYIFFHKHEKAKNTSFLWRKQRDTSSFKKQEEAKKASFVSKDWSEKTLKETCQYERSNIFSFPANKS